MKALRVKAIRRQARFALPFDFGGIAGEIFLSAE